MHWVYLSPHFDDVALSCGGLIWEQAQSGEMVEIWTICAGRPLVQSISDFARSLLIRWGSVDDAVTLRGEEDMRANRILGALTTHLSIPDAIYRYSPTGSKPLYTSEADLFGPLRSEELGLVETLNEQLRKLLPRKSILVCPLALGGHVDHQLVKLAARGLDKRKWFFADFPYVSQLSCIPRAFTSGMIETIFPVSEAGVDAWGEAVAEHKSQISTFWSHSYEMKTAVRDYWAKVKGLTLWQVV